MDGFAEQSEFVGAVEEVTTQIHAQKYQAFDPYNYIRGASSTDYIATTSGIDYVQGLLGDDTIYFSLCSYP